MRLLQCSLHSIRRHQALELDFHPGLTLITGANETGKSSLVEALHRTLFLKATATGTPVQRLRSLQHSGHPQVTLRFEAQGHDWTLQKRFSGQSGTTHLTGPGQPPRLGAEAEEHLADLLGVDSTIGSRQAGKVLPSRWAHLWVMQGEAGRELLALGGDHYDLPGLIDQLEQQAGAALQSPLDQHLHDQLKQLVSTSVTTRGARHQSRLWLSEQAVVKQREVLTEACSVLSRFEQASDELDNLDEEQRHLANHQRPKLEAERCRLQALQQRQERATAERKGLQRQLAPMEQQHKQLTLQARNLQQTLTALRHKQNELQQVEHTLALCGKAVSAADTKLVEQRKQHGQHLKTRQDLEQRGQQLRRLEEQSQLTQRLQQLHQQRQQHQALQRQKNELSVELERLRAPSDTALQAIKEQHNRVEALTIRVEAMASTITLDRSDQTVLLNGTPIPIGTPQRHASSYSITIGEGVALSITPGGGEGLEEISREQRQLQSAVADHLKQWNAASMADLDARCLQRTTLLTQLAVLQQQQGSIDPKAGDIEEAQLKQRLDQLAVDLLDGDPITLEVHKTNTMEALQAELSSCRDRYRQANDALQVSQKRLQTEEEQVQSQKQQLQHLQLKREALVVETRGLDQQSKAMVRDHGEPEVLAANLEDLDNQVRQLRSSLQALAPGAMDPEMANAATKRQLTEVQQQEQALQQRLQHLSGEQGALLERCRALGSNDPYGAKEAAERELHQAEAAHRHEALQVRAQQHLLSLFETARTDLSNRYTAPLSESIAGYLQPLLLQSGDACQLNYGAKEGLHNLTLQRQGLALPFLALSGGMKEQLNAALRLALADTLRSGHGGCLPVLFDDAFTNTDPDRLQTVLSMLRRAVDRGLQVIVLSCDGSPYEAIADAVVELT